ncbi:MAG TPA: M20/M25/M40 family metallo-hydrolase [Gemmataceae bacterium]|nr:M20/M25/M40 family metallo-hydrolase [Gemmataceae bacterium]
MTARRWLIPARLLIVLILAAPALGAERTDAARIKAVEERLRLDVTFLASAECEGRGPGTRGIDLAADYIANEFKKAGLRPAGEFGSYFQPFAIAGAVLENCSPLVLHGPKGQTIELKQGVHFHPFGLGSSGRVTAAPLVFAGHGITSPKDPEYDDYRDLDVAGKVVVLLRDTPRALSRQAVGGNWRRRYGAFTEKLRNAEEHQAAGVIFVNDWDTAQTGDDLLDFNFLATAASRSQLPAFHMSRGVLEEMLWSSRGLDLRALEEDTDRTFTPHGVALDGWTVSFDVKVRRAKDAIPVKNVVGVLEGKGRLAHETVIIGAHYDHVGYGGQSSLSGSKKMAIHHGADDNASGTATLIELARRFGPMPDREGRRLVFIAFSGEELGLFGSEHYCQNPLFPLDNTVAMVNLDMVGRLRPDPETGKDVLQVHGVGTAKTFEALIEALNQKHGFKLQKHKSGFGPSDHAAFYAKKIPVFFFFTGDHPDYHRPTDTADRLNISGMRRIADLTEDLIVQLATAPERPEYVRVTEGSRTTPGVQGPRLGIRPDYNDDKDGVLIGGVLDGLPAAKAGLKEGDRIVRINGKEVKSLQNYMVLMGQQKRGDTIELAIIRDGQPMTVKVKLD